MRVPVPLSEMLQGMKVQSRDEPCYLDAVMGRVEQVSKHDLRAAHNYERDGVPGKPCPEIELARRVQTEQQNFLLLPTPYEIHEYGIMERFCRTIEDGWMSERLFAAITGPGAFRRFRNESRKLGIDDDWAEYRLAALKQIAIQWCTDNEVEYVDDI
ncbi:MAG: hypothetical protein HQ567_29190 [Candidatus Nealsonbacteria bacterium]|nr:hypothetical protein [Candidatus Nealsonbacteria bacterium]